MAIQYIDEAAIEGKRVLVRVDYNVPLTTTGAVADDTRMTESLVTLTRLLEKGNKLILIAHLGRPKGKDSSLSLAPIATHLQTILPSGYTVELIPDFLSRPDLGAQIEQAPNNSVVYLLENIRYYPEEKSDDPYFLSRLAQLGDVYVNDGFSVAHRKDASVVGLAERLPCYGGLLLKREVNSIMNVIKTPQRPFVAILAGAKISTKIGLVDKFCHIADDVLIGGAMANNFLRAQGYEVGRGLIESEYIAHARVLMEEVEKSGKRIILPVDRRIGQKENTTDQADVRRIGEVGMNDEPLDIGPETETLFSLYVKRAKTILWNGPLGYFENPQYAKGSMALFKSIVENKNATTLIGGGETISLVKHHPDRQKISHLSTGGGAMLELIEKGTLPGLDALSREKGE